MDFLQQDFVIRPHEAGPEGTLRLAPLFDLFQDAAAEHAGRLGCGMEFLKTRSLLWVLSRMALQIGRMPRIGEKVTVLTYPSGVERLFALRQFTVRDASGQNIARASSCWLLLASDTFRPKRVEENLGVALPLNPDKPRHFPVPDKIVMPESGGVSFPVTVRASQIDVNGHLNNAFFAAFVHDMFGELTGENRPPKTLQILFLHAGSIGCTIVCRGVLSGDRYQLEGRSPDGKILYFQADGIC